MLEREVFIEDQIVALSEVLMRFSYRDFAVVLTLFLYRLPQIGFVESNSVILRDQDARDST